MIIVAGTVPVKPEMRAEAVQLGAWMTAKTEAEPGCKQYRFYSDITDENTFLIFEQWENAEVLLAHFQTSHVATFAAQLPRIVAGPMAVKRYDVSAVSDI
jgi:quinol monooxygenase YgiN